LSVLLDTSVWSLALRRRGDRKTASEARVVHEWVELVREGRAILIGPVRQEVLSGIRHTEEFGRLKEHLRAFSDLPLEAADYEVAAALSNDCRRVGVAAGPTDALIAAAAHRHAVPLFTTDSDFRRLRRVLSFELHSPR
jgi:predicted nucleic acid-binding protein